MPITQRSSIDYAVETYVAESRYTLQERPGVIWNFIQKESLPTGSGPTVTIPKYGQVNTYALTEGIDMAQAQEISDTGVSITPSEFGAQILITDMALKQLRDDMLRVAGKVLGESYDRVREQTLCDDMDNFSVALGAAGTALNVGHVYAGEASLKYNAPADGSAGRGGEAAPDPIALFITPATAHSLKKTLMGGIGAAGATQNSPETSRAPSGEQFMVDGVSVRTTLNFNKDTSDDVKGGMLSAQALLGVEFAGGPSAKKEEDTSLRAWEINYVGRWGRAEWADAWGREMLFDSANPTS
jgi:hypothetical protein